jgi:hypothetical protein
LVIVCEPDAVFAPVQPLLAVHAVALVLDQFSVTGEPACTLEADAESVAVGTGGGGTLIDT